MCRDKARRRGFTLLIVLLLTVLMSAAVALTLNEVVGLLQDGGRIRAVEMIKSSTDQGVNRAFARIEQEDISFLDDANFDIFTGNPTPVTPTDFVPPMLYPTAGPYANQFRVRYGVRRGQITRPPAGEDVRTSVGQIYEVQVSIEANAPGMPPVEERTSLGVLIPRKSPYE